MPPLSRPPEVVEPRATHLPCHPQRTSSPARERASSSCEPGACRPPSQAAQAERVPGPQVPVPSTCPLPQQVEAGGTCLPLVRVHACRLYSCPPHRGRLQLREQPSSSRLQCRGPRALWVAPAAPRPPSRTAPTRTARSTRLPCPPPAPGPQPRSHRVRSRLSRHVPCSASLRRHRAPEPSRTCGSDAPPFQLEAARRGSLPLLEAGARNPCGSTPCRRRQLSGSRAWSGVHSCGARPDSPSPLPPREVVFRTCPDPSG